MQQGLLPAGWVYGLHDQRQAEFDEQRRILIELHKYLFRDPVTGPDGVAVAIWYEGTNGPRLPLFPVPYTQWPGAPPDRLAPRFLSKQEAGAFAAQLVQRVRAGGVAALRQFSSGS